MDSNQSKTETTNSKKSFRSLPPTGRKPTVLLKWRMKNLELNGEWFNFPFSILNFPLPRKGFL
jgi:hypothetical protein